MIFYSHVNKTHKKGFTLSLVLKVKGFGTRNWLLLQWPNLYYRRIIRLRRIIRTSVQLYSVLRQIVEQNSSEADSSVSTS